MTAAIYVRKSTDQHVADEQESVAYCDQVARKGELDDNR
jgi:hypothetical protein